MNRRDFIGYAQIGSVLCLSPTFTYSTISKRQETEDIRLLPSGYKPIDLPADRRVPFGWPAIGILPGESVIFKPEKEITERNLWFRISVAQEIWDEKLIHINLPVSGEYLGTVDIRFSTVLVPYEVEIEKKYIPKINRQGLKITLESSSPFWFFSQSATDVNNNTFLPHLISFQEEKGTLDDFLDCFLSVNSVQAFGWREGTVLDGLWQIYLRKNHSKAMEAINQHLNLFFDKDQNLAYETGRGAPKYNQIDGIESTIPFATLSRINPRHPILNTVVSGWKELEKRDGMVIDGTMISAEGCYTVAYPMAVIGKAWKDEALKRNSLAQLKHRFVLIHQNQLYLRYYTERKYTYLNWARGAAWFLLGFARTISELKDEIMDEEIVEKFIEEIKIVISMQREDGLWGCFMHDKDSLPDTSGSAGISAAILTGINNGFLPEDYRENAEKCWRGLQNYITPDGFLKGVAQDNRGGIELQESDYRVIAQMGMGLLAQLYASL